MKNINRIDQLKVLFENHGGILKTINVIEFGIHHSFLKKAVELGFVEKIKHGVYQWGENTVPSAWDLISYLYPDGIICSLSALHYYRYIDRTPNVLHLAFERTINRKRLKNNLVRIVAHFVSTSLLDIGITLEQIENHQLKIYNRERVICDVIRHMNRMDREIVNQAIKSYLTDPQKQIARLKTYSKTLRVENKVNQLIGMWL